MIGNVNVPGALATDIANKVDKVNGKGLSSNDFTTAEKQKLAGLSQITVDNSLSSSSTNPIQNKVINTALSNKVDKVSGKGLSTNDYTTEEKNKLAGLSNYDDTTLQIAVAGKVDKVTGKGLSTEDYTTTEKNKLASLSVTPYIYMTFAEYINIMPIIDTLYWVINMDGTHAIYKNGVCIEGDNKIWTTIQDMVRNGTFANSYSVGDQFTINYNGNNTLWDVVAIDVAIPADTTKTHSVTLISHDCLEYIMLDNDEPNNSDAYRKNGGNNRYKYSNIRQWLNSSGVAGSWYSNQHNADTAPDYASTKAGFMSYIDPDFLEVIGKTKIVTAKSETDGGSYETLSDEYFYIASETEVGLSGGSSFTEGSLFPYFSDDDKRKKQYNNNGSIINVSWALRTPYYYTGRDVYSVNSSGKLNYMYSMDSKYGIAPVCNII